MSVFKFLEAVMTVHATFALFVVHSRFGTASGQLYISSISGDAPSKFEQSVALLSKLCFHSPVIFRLINMAFLLP